MAASSEGPFIKLPAAMISEIVPNLPLEDIESFAHVNKEVHQIVKERADPIFAQLSKVFESEHSKNLLKKLKITKGDFNSFSLIAKVFIGHDRVTMETLIPHILENIQFLAKLIRAKDGFELEEEMSDIDLLCRYMNDTSTTTSSELLRDLMGESWAEITTSAAKESGLSLGVVKERLDILKEKGMSDEAIGHANIDGLAAAITTEFDRAQDLTSDQFTERYGRMDGFDPASEWPS